MIMLDGTEPIDKDERIYRRVAELTGYYKRDRIPPLSASAFKPLSSDIDGISITRAGYVAGPAAAAAAGFAGKNYYVIELIASDLISLGLTIRPDPDLPRNELGHAVIPELNFNDIDSDFVATAMDSARNLFFIPRGPFPGTRPPIVRAPTV